MPSLCFAPKGLLCVDFIWCPGTKSEYLQNTYNGNSDYYENTVKKNRRIRPGLVHSVPNEINDNNDNEKKAKCSLLCRVLVSYTGETLSWQYRVLPFKCGKGVWLQSRGIGKR